MIKMEMKQIKAEIKDYVRDHYKYYGWYPYDVQVGDTLYTYEQYMDIHLTRKEKRELEAITRQQCGEARLHRRARMVLLAHAGESCRNRVQLRAHWVHGNPKGGVG